MACCSSSSRRYSRCPFREVGGPDLETGFAYQALNAAARDVRRTIAADSPSETREKLRAQGLVDELVERLSRRANRSTTALLYQQTVPTCSYL